MGKYGLSGFINEEDHLSIFQKIAPLMSRKISSDDMKELRMETIHFQISKELKDLDRALPYIAYLKFYNYQKSRGVKPLEFFYLDFHEKLNGVKFI